MNEMDPIIIVRALISIPVIYFIPGYVIFTAFGINKIENFKLSFIEIIFLQILISIIFTSWIAFPLAIWGYFSLVNLLGLIVFFIIIIVLKFKVKFNLSCFSQPIFNKQSLFLFLIVILAVCLFFQPSEEIFGYDDAYIHVNIGAIIANYGSIVFYDPLITSIPEDVIKIFGFRSTQQFNGLLIQNYGTGEIHPSFLHLNSIWIAILFLLFGLTGSLYVTSIFALLAIFSVFFVAKHLFNFNIAAITLSLLTINYLQIYFSRSHSAEILFELLIFGGIFLFILFTKSKNPILGIISALCMGLIFVTKIEGILLFIPIIIYLTGLNIANKLEKCHFYFIIPLIFTFLFILINYIIIIPSYIQWSFFAKDVPQTQMIFIICFIIVVNLLPRSYFIKIIKQLIIHEKKLQFIISSLIAVFFIYYFLTLQSTPIGQYGQNLIMLSWYLTTFVIIFGIIGLILMIYKKPYILTYFFLGICLIYFFFFVSNIHHAHGGPWWMRRYIFIVIPSLYIGTSYCIYKMTDLFQGNFQKNLPCIIFIFLFISSITISYPIINHVQYKGVIQQTHNIFDEFGNNSILIFADCSYPHIAYPLRHIFGKNAILLRRDLYGVQTKLKNTEDVNKIMQAYEIWTESGKTIYIINPCDEFINAFNGKLEFSLYKSGKINVPYLTQTPKFPDNYIYLRRNITIYKISLN